MLVVVMLNVIMPSVVTSFNSLTKIDFYVKNSQLVLVPMLQNVIGVFDANLRQSGKRIELKNRMAPQHLS